MASSPTIEPPNENAGPQSPPQKKSICKLCGKTFNSPQLLVAHKRMTHPGAPGQGHTKSAATHPFRCTQCGARFQSPQALGKHRSVMHNIPGTSKRAVNERKAQLAKKDKGRPATTNPFKCPECGKRYPSALLLGSHRKNLHGVKGTSITAEYMRNRHKAESPEPCKICGKEFSTNYGVAAHMRGHQRRGEITGQNFQPRRTLSNGNSAGNTNAEEAIAFWISQAARDCEDYAKRVQLLPEDFASRVLAVVSGSSKEIRQRYRLSD